MGQRRRQVGIGGIGQVDLDLHDAGPRCRLVTLDDEAVGHGDGRGHLARGRPGRRRDGLGQVARGVVDGGRRAVLTLVPQHGKARVLVGVELVAEGVQDVRAKLDRVGAAELLEREADGEGGRDPAHRVDRRDRPRSADGTGRSHDLQYLCGGEGAHLHGPVERHVERARRAVGDQVAVALSPPGTEVLRTCGPGTISGRVF